MPRDNRLRKKRDFDTVLNDGKRYRSESFLLVYKSYEKEKEPLTKVPRFGVVTAKKHEKSAAKRNKAKRKMKEILRRLKDKIEPQETDLVFLTNQYVFGKPYDELKKEVTNALIEAGLIEPKAN